MKSYNYRIKKAEERGNYEVAEEIRCERDLAYMHDIRCLASEFAQELKRGDYRAAITVLRVLRAACDKKAAGLKNDLDR